MKSKQNLENIRRIGVSFESLFDVFSLWNRFHKKKYGSVHVEEFELDKEFEVDEGFEIGLKKDEIYKEKMRIFMNSESYSKRNPIEGAVDGIDSLLEDKFKVILLNSYFNYVPDANLRLIDKHFRGRFEGDIYFTNNYKNGDSRQTFICLEKEVGLLIDVDYQQAKEFAMAARPSFLLESPRNDNVKIGDRWRDYVTPISFWKDISKRLC